MQLNFSENIYDCDWNLNYENLKLKKVSSKAK